MTVDYVISQRFKGFSREVPSSIKEAWAALLQNLNRIDTDIMEAVVSYTKEKWELIEDPAPIGPMILVGPCCEKYNSWAFVQPGLPFMFVDQRIADWPANLIEASLAHELAHYYHFATNSVAVDRATEEMEVDMRITEWGYDHSRLWLCKALSMRDLKAPTLEMIDDIVKNSLQQKSLNQSA